MWWQDHRHSNSLSYKWTAPLRLKDSNALTFCKVFPVGTERKSPAELLNGAILLLLSRFTSERQTCFKEVFGNYISWLWSWYIIKFTGNSLRIVTVSISVFMLALSPGCGTNGLDNYWLVSRNISFPLVHLWTPVCIFWHVQTWLYKHRNCKRKKKKRYSSWQVTVDSGPRWFFRSLSQLVSIRPFPGRMKDQIVEKKKRFKTYSTACRSWK